MIELQDRLAHLAPEQLDPIVQIGRVARARVRELVHQVLGDAAAAQQAPERCPALVLPLARDPEDVEVRVKELEQVAVAELPPVAAGNDEVGGSWIASDVSTPSRVAPFVQNAGEEGM